METIVRMQLDFSPEAIRALREIAELLNTSEAEAIRKALGLMQFAVREQTRGARFIVQGPRWGRRREIIKL